MKVFCVFSNFLNRILNSSIVIQIFNVFPRKTFVDLLNKPNPKLVQTSSKFLQLYIDISKTEL